MNDILRLLTILYDVNNFRVVSPFCRFERTPLIAQLEERRSSTQRSSLFNVNSASSVTNILLMHILTAVKKSSGEVVLVRDI